MKSKMFSLMALLLLAIGCKDQKKSSGTEETVSTDTVQSSISIEKLEGSPEYSDAVLKMVKPAEPEIEPAEGGTDFEFELENYELGTQTASDLAGQLANSGDGQHIHFILDNQPYAAHYETSFKKELPEGTHYLVTFLSRSYHESVKNENAFIAEKIVVGDSTGQLNVDLGEPTLIYSRPKGEYSGKDTENLLLDFYLLNTTLSENGNFVRATINGEEFDLTEWAPYIVKGLPKGEVTVKLELLDGNGALLPGDFNSVERTVILKE
ncbi:hypothetical protein [Sinomicrobium soli]|uniref:hypothetical protein n=1 Tax=Sinomicrobium sp. N-1-3-6 TaxID=2219864 RepID=UPI000DCD0CA0|nr:hypothetical protein [Sinomicrobium sp. N-1-3-6]RAV28700.1 hypothetical protein DN748_12155 [Sinomicrobium sp. N-1-3-6]